MRRFLCVIPWRRREVEDPSDSAVVPDIEEIEEHLDEIERRQEAIKARVEVYLARQKRGSP